MAALSDELIKRIAEGSGRAYWNESKAMAQEIMEWRAKAAAAAKAAQSGGAHPFAMPGIPYP